MLFGSSIRILTSRETDVGVLSEETRKAMIVRSIVQIIAKIIVQTIVQTIAINFVLHPIVIIAILLVE